MKQKLKAKHNEKILKIKNKTKRTCQKHSKTQRKRGEKVDKRSKMERKRNKRE